MSPEKRAEVLRALHLFGREGATNAQLSKVLRRTPSGVAGYMRELVKDGAVFIIGHAERTKAPTFVMTEGQSIPPVEDIFEQCRQNWQGYHIHKIFGSASRRLTV